MFQFQPSAAKNIESLCYSGKKLWPWQCGWMLWGGDILILSKM
jgi:hypothetical protein